jgi:hypothetical protein
MNFRQYAVGTTVEGTQHVIPQGPAAALETALKTQVNGLLKVAGVYRQ